jgi:hypothetical protein
MAGEAWAVCGARGAGHRCGDVAGVHAESGEPATRRCCPGNDDPHDRVVEASRGSAGLPSAVQEEGLGAAGRLASVRRAIQQRWSADTGSVLDTVLVTDDRGGHWR